MRSRECSALPRNCSEKIVPLTQIDLCQEVPADCRLSELHPLMV